MAALSKKLLQSLAARRAIQDRGVVAVPSAALSRTHRQRLLLTGYLCEFLKGWYRFCSPEAGKETLSWTAAFWPVLTDYLAQRFGEDWCLGPESSLRVWVGDWTVPMKLVVRSPRGGNKPVALPHGASLLDLRLPQPASRDIEVRDGLRLLTLPAALCACGPKFFSAYPDHARAALAMLGDDGVDLARRLQGGGRSVVAGRLAGALRNVGRAAMADRLRTAMRAAGHECHERDPFAEPTAAGMLVALDLPESNRLRMDWLRQRSRIFECHPPPPGSAVGPEAFFPAMDAGYAADAFHSLSLEGYRVTSNLIERTRAVDWAPPVSGGAAPAADAPGAEAPGAGAPGAGAPGRRDELAARGYWLAFQAVKTSLGRIFAGVDAAVVASEDLLGWYRALYAPRLAPGLLAGIAGSGYRHGSGAVQFARQLPPRPESVDGMMRTLFELLRAEPEPGVRAVMGHLELVRIQPFIEGNGPLARLLMNVFRVAGGYPWLVVPLSRRVDYRGALEQATGAGDAAALARFLAG